MTTPIYTSTPPYKVQDINVYADRCKGQSGEANSRRPFPQINSFRSWVISELDRRRKHWPTPIVSPFVRMTSCNQDLINKYKYFSLGLHGFDNQDIDIFSSTYGTKRDIVGYAYDDSGKKILISTNQLTYVPPNTAQFDNLPADNPQKLAINDRIVSSQQEQDQIAVQGAHPIPGITGVTIRRAGLANPFVIDIRWQCYNQQQLEFLRNHFLIIGSYIVMEWGQMYSNTSTFTPLNFGDSDILDILSNSIIRGRKYVIDKYNAPNNGNYDFVVGQVGNFTVDFDSQQNVYKCSTRLVSMSENMWGVSLHNTRTVLVPTDARADETDVNTDVDIQSYFTSQGGFRKLLSTLEATSNGTKFVRPPNPAFKNNATTAKETAQVSPNPDDLVFISWSAFTTDLMSDIINFFDAASSVANIDVNNTMYDKLRNELTVLLGLGGRPSEGLPDEIYCEQKRLWELEWVGYHPDLRSIDPNSLILITSQVVQNNAAVEWTNGGIFGALYDTNRAKLTEGVWLNAGMIERAFMETTTLQAAIQRILSAMNVAVGGYWQLQLYYDDEIGVYKVIDYKFDHETDTIPMYVFNSNRNEHHNETVSIRFDTAFPPELITQMMVTSMIQTSSPDEQKKLFQQYPLIGNTSPFMFAVNWTSLEDILKRDITNKRNSMNILKSSSNVKHTPRGSDNASGNELSNTARIKSTSGIGPETGTNPIASGKAGTPRTITGQLSAPESDVTPTAPRPNTSAFPSTFNDGFKLDRFPVEPQYITSDFGQRTAPIGGASSQHNGIDLSIPQGSKVYATNPGVVIEAKITSDNLGIIVIKHEKLYTTTYKHLSELWVNSGEHVFAGQKIARSGGTPNTRGAGISTGPHLHFEIRKNGKAINPRPYLNKETPFVPASPSANTSASDTETGQIKTAPKTPYDTSIQTADDQSNDKAMEYMKKFGDNITSLIYLTASELRNRITSDGYNNIGNKLINGFVSPFPTKTSVEVKIPGISGISISDTFMVDKLPFIFANYGAFQTTEIREDIEVSGWYTTIRGYFKMLWPAGGGGRRID